MIESVVMSTKPLIKFVGGKAWLTKYISSGIRKKLEKTNGRYVEPFVGGGAVALSLGLPHMLLADAFEPVVHMHRTIRDYPKQVAWALKALISKGVDKDSFLRVRGETYFNAAAEAARLIYLNKLSFNGLVRVNSAGIFNMPFGRSSDGKSPMFPSVDRFIEVSEALKTSEILCQDFRETFKMVKAGDVVMADPPYAGTYSSYTANKFTDDDQQDLADCLMAAAGRGVFFLLTNADAPIIRKLYAGWADIVPNIEPRSISRDGIDRGNTACLLITNELEIISSADARA